MGYGTIGSGSQAGSQTRSAMGRQTPSRPRWGPIDSGVGSCGAMASADPMGSNGGSMEGQPQDRPWLICREHPQEYDRTGGSPDPSAHLAELDGLAEEDLVEELGTRIIRLSAHAAALECRLLTLIADFDRRRGWELSGHKD